MQSTSPTNRCTRIIPRLISEAGCLLALLVLSMGGVQAVGPATATDNNMGALIRQLGADASTDAATLGRLRAMIAQGQTHSAAAGSGELQEGLWSGVIERIYVDNMDNQGNLVSGQTQYYMDTGSEQLQVYFMDESTGHAASGRHMVIKGYRTGRRVLAVEGGKNYQDLLRPVKSYRSSKP